MKIKAPAFLRSPLFLLIGVFLLAFGPLLFGDLVWKDLAVIKNEPALSMQGRAWHLLSCSSPPDTATYQPIPVLTLMIGVNRPHESRSALVPRLINITLFFAICLLLLQLLATLKITPWVSVFAVSLFAIHPTHVEVLATLAGRAPLLGHLFALSAVFMAMRTTQTRKTHWAAFVLFLLAGLSQKSALVWAAFPLVFGYLNLATAPNKSTLRTMISAAALTFILQWTTTGYLWPNAHDRFLDSGNIVSNFTSSFGVMGLRFPALLLSPNTMTPDPSANLHALGSATYVLWGIVIIGCLWFMAWRFRKVFPLVAVSVFAFSLGALLQAPLFAGSLPSQLSVFGASFGIPFLLAALFSRVRVLPGPRRLVYALPVLALILCTVRSLSWRHETILLASLPGIPGPAYWATEIREIESAPVGSDLARRSTTGVLAAAIDTAGPDQRLVKQALLIELKRGGKIERCQELFELLHTERPTTVGLSALKGRMLLKAGDGQGAKSAFMEGRDNDHLDVDSRWHLGATYARAGRDDWAEMLWREALKKCHRWNQQETALKILIQMSYMADRGILDQGLLVNLCRRQLNHLPSVGPIRPQIERLIDRATPTSSAVD